LSSNAQLAKLLAINFGGLGDEVLFLPTLQSIKSAHPSCRVTILTEPRGRGIRQLTDLIDDSLTFDIKKRPLVPQDYVRLVQLLRGGRFDAVLSSGSSPQVSGLLYLSGIKRRIGYGANALARMLLTDPVPLKRQQHAAMMYHDLAAGLGVNGPCERPQVVARDDALKRMMPLFHVEASDTGPKKVVMIHPGTSKLAIDKGVYKTWSPSDWATLILDLMEKGRLRVLLSGGPDDAQTITEICAQLDQRAPGITGGGDDRFINAFGKTANVEDLAALIDMSDLLVCVDSAPMHIGVGLNKKMVALFGPTDPAKLLWPDARFVALRDEAAAKKYANIDPFTQRPALTPASPLQPVPYVRIPPDTVFRTAMGQLN
jgi:ADP-heptose:LPS heptosyltransferase